jgi:uncharacterized protein YyaL (SSP411 family)
MANRLASETSAYLRQHMHNPVDWHPWGAEAWEQARALGRPVLVSIGYSSCHWCHVMERESFEDPDVAALMNRELVCIKVDREERPDVDQIYMDAVMHLEGQGGWPLNVFCTPDGRPFFGGTYFPPRRAYGRPSWGEIVAAVGRAFHERPDEVETQAHRLVSALSTRPHVEGEAPLGVDTLGALCAQLLSRADRTNGGFGRAPKFPTPPNLEALLAASRLGAAPDEALAHVAFTLEQMARGGLFDQLGGGFHRYSTDERWLVPHFEKMLYDNGQLLRVYTEAWRRLRSAELAWPVEETVVWLEREMRSPEGGFFASQDADSEGEEGRFFVWTPAAIGSVLGAERSRAFCAAYGVEAEGNFEHGVCSVLSHGLTRERRALAAERSHFATERAALLAARSQRVAPDTDRKHVCAWIGYTVGGLAFAASAFDRPAWLRMAQDAADFALTRLSDNGRNLRRIWDGREARIPAFLDDHAGLLVGLLDLHRAGAGDRYLDAAIAVAEEIAARFHDAETRDLHYTAGADPTLAYRPMGDVDGATPASTGHALLGLARLASLTGRADLDRIVDDVLATWSALAARAPAQLSTLVRTAALREAGLGVALVLGDPADPRSLALASRARALLGPEDAVVLVRPGAPPAWLAPHWLEGRPLVGGDPTAYLCRGRTCSLPARTPEALALPGAP